MTSETLRVLIIDENTERAKLVKEGLSNNTTVKLATRLYGKQLLDLVADWGPDVIIMDCHSPNRDTIESLRQVAQANPKPIVMFVEKGEREHMQEAIEAGVSAYVVDGLTPKRVRPLIDTAIARFQMMAGLKKELRKTKEDLAARKTIERAKGLLMEQRNMSEAEAFRAMRDLSQREGKPLKDVAANIISVFDLLTTQPKQDME